MEVVMKKMLCTVAVAIFGISEGMNEGTITMRLNSNKGILSIDNGKSCQVEVRVIDRARPEEGLEVVVPIGFIMPTTVSPIVEAKMRSLQESLHTDVFGIKPNIDFVLGDRAIEKFNNDLFPQLGSRMFDFFNLCSDEQKRELRKNVIACSEIAAQAYLGLLYQANDDEQSKKIETYFDNVLEKLAMIANMLPVPGDSRAMFSSLNDQYKFVTMGLIRCGEKLYTPEYRASATLDQQKKIDKYDEICRDRIINLIDLNTQGIVTLNGAECHEIVRSLDSAVSARCLLLSRLSDNGLTLIKESNDMFCRPDLVTTVEVLKETLSKIEKLKQDHTNMVSYVATMYCLKNLEDLHFSMPAYDAYDVYDDEEMISLRKKMSDSADKILQILVQ
jgi:hypothetical protein